MSISFVLRQTGVFAGIVCLCFQLASWLPTNMRRTDVENLDFTVYRHAAEAAAAGTPMYGEHRGSLLQQHTGYFYPPTFAHALRPLAALGPEGFQKAWYLILFGAFWAFAAGLVKLAGLELNKENVLTAGFLVIVCPGTRMTMGFGNVDIVIWALVTWGIAMEGIWGGLLLVAAASVKVYPAFAFLALMRNTRTLLVGAGALALGALALSSGFFSEWMRVGLPSLSAGCFHPGNISLTVGVIRPMVDTSDVLPEWGRFWLSTAPALLTLVMVLVSMKIEDLKIRASVVVLMSLWLSPVCWWYQTTFLLMLVAAFVRSRTRLGDA